MTHQTRSKARVRDLGEVFTAEREVNAMLDMVPDDVWQDIDKTFLEPACGNGNFLVAILRRKLDCISRTDATPTFRGVMIMRSVKSIYGIDVMEDNVLEARRRMYFMVMERLPELIAGAFNTYVSLGGKVLEFTDEMLRRNIVVGNFLTDFDTIQAGWAAEQAAWDAAEE